MSFVKCDATSLIDVGKSFVGHGVSFNALIRRDVLV